MELKSKVQTEDVGTRCRIRVHIHARTKSVEGKTVHFRVITAVVGKDEGILHTGGLGLPIISLSLSSTTPSSFLSTNFTSPAFNVCPMAVL